MLLDLLIWIFQRPLPACAHVSDQAIYSAAVTDSGLYAARVSDSLVYSATLNDEEC